MSVYLCICISVLSQICNKYIWHVCQMSQKVQNVKMVFVSVCVCPCVCVYLYFCVCGVPFINLVSLAFYPNKPKSAKCDFLKIPNFKNIINRCTIFLPVGSLSIGA